FDVACMNYLCLANDKDAAIEISRKTLEPRVAGGSFGRAKIVEEAFESRCFVGNARDISGQIEKFSEAGVRHHVLTMLFRGSLEKMLSDMKIISKEIFPSFK
ncbi:MAG: hypothetical protein ACREBS_03105, partial [Nitrososphaerales archaeon]